MIVLLAVILALLAPAAVASAQGPGGTDEYVEQLPGAGGNNPTNQSSEDPETDEPLTPSEAEVVEEQGADGSAAVELAQATGPDDGGGSDRAGSGGDGDGGPGSDAGSGLPEVIGDVAGGSDDSDMGVLLPVVIGATLVAALAFVIIRRRRSHAGS